LEILFSLCASFTNSGPDLANAEIFTENSLIIIGFYLTCTVAD